jgi:phosphatidate cytidylyltransferase
MAFNWQTFRTRASTAVVFVLVMLAGLLWNRWSFFILFSIIHFGAWWEYWQLVCKFNPDYQKSSHFHKYGIMTGGWCLVLLFTNYELVLGNTSLTEVGFWSGLIIAVLLPVAMFIESKLLFFKNISYSLLGLLYISLPIALLMDLRTEGNARDSEILPLLVIFSLWINDTMAYIVGSVIGKTPLSKISPKKTWEGTAGGVVLTIVVMCVIVYFTEWLPLSHTAAIAGIAAISGTFGDLFESKLKRMAGVKDSGAIMPGHGGFLDRFDSLLFASVGCWCYAVLFLR